MEKRGANFTEQKRGQISDPSPVVYLVNFYSDFLVRNL